MHMNMEKEFLVPGMENLYDPGSGAKILSVRGKFQDSPGAGLVEKGVKGGLITGE